MKLIARTKTISFSQIRLHRPQSTVWLCPKTSQNQRLVIHGSSKVPLLVVKCQFVSNRDFSVLNSMPFEGASSGGKRYDGQDKDTFLPATFRKVQKIGKELKSNGTSNKAGFL